MTAVTTVEAYIAAAPAEQREALAKLRALIRAHLPGAREQMGSSGFPVYTRDAGQWLAGFAWRKKGAMLYIMDAALLDRHAQQLGKLRSGKSCIDWRSSATLSIEELQKLAQRMLGEVARDGGTARQA